MIKITYTKPPLDQVFLNDIPFGTSFYGKIGNISGVFLKSAAGTIHLDNPINHWELSNKSMITLYKEVDIEVKV